MEFGGQVTLSGFRSSGPLALRQAQVTISRDRCSQNLPVSAPRTDHAIGVHKGERRRFSRGLGVDDNGPA